jgi:hypothetical protein
MKKPRTWKIIFIACSLIYMSWVIHAGRNEFDRIHKQYRRIVEQLDKERIRSASLAELTAECRRTLREQTGLKEDVCSSWPLALVEAKTKEIEKRLLKARKRGIIKVVLFYTGFVSVFLLAPIILTYLLIVAVILIYRNIKFIR